MIIIMIISSPNQNIWHSVIGNWQKVIIINNSMHVGAFNKGKEKCCKVGFAFRIIFKTIPQLEQILSKQSTSGDKNNVYHSKQLACLW